MFTLANEVIDYILIYLIIPQFYLSVTVIQSNWCLKSPTLDVTVGEEDVSGLEFVQTGFLLQCHTSHPTALVSTAILEILCAPGKADDEKY